MVAMGASTRVGLVAVASIVAGCSNSSVGGRPLALQSLCALPASSGRVTIVATFVAPDFETQVLVDPDCPGIANRVVRFGDGIGSALSERIVRETHNGRRRGEALRARVEGHASMTSEQRYFVVESVSNLSTVRYSLPQEAPPPY